MPDSVRPMIARRWKKSQPAGVSSVRDASGPRDFVRAKPRVRSSSRRSFAVYPIIEHIMMTSQSINFRDKQKDSRPSPCLGRTAVASAVPPKLSSKDHLYCLQQDRHGLTRRHTDHLLGKPFGSRLRSVIRRNASAGFPLSPAHCAKRLPVTSLHQGHFYLMQYLYHLHFILSSTFFNFPKILN